MAAHQKHIWGFGEKQAIPGYLYVSKNSNLLLTAIWILKSDYRFFYYMVFCDTVLLIQNRIIFLLTDDETVVLSNSYIIAIEKDVYQFSQSVAKQKNK